MTATYAVSETVDCVPRLVIISGLERSRFEEPSLPPTKAVNTPFKGSSAKDVAAALCALSQQKTSDLDSSYFAILDERSATDKTALLVQIVNAESSSYGFDIDSVRASCETVNYTLNSLNVGVTSMGEQQALASANQSNILRHPDTSQRPRGGSEPRKKLGCE